MLDAEPCGESSPGDYPDRWKHHLVGKLVRRTKNYIVHIDAKENRLDWETSAAYDQRQESDPAYDRSKYNTVHCDVAVLEARPCVGLDQRVIDEFRTLLGEALVCAFENDYNTANKMITSAAVYIDARSQEKSRLWYLGACLWTAGPCAILAVIFAINKEVISITFGPALYWTILAAFAGALGALFSVILRIGRLSVDCASGKSLHDLEGFSRILAGAISGTFVVVAFYSGIFFPAVIQAERAQYAVILLAMISGISERSAVSLIAKFHSEKLNMNVNERETT
ncbi:hypothetical protein [Hydrogenophaga sp.]|uniref:hypothetical protein n=1 Tax=Hydrogenophaga sp. TaxID=1904254 RepID=UPI0025C4B6F0|nr:hypothetical protein [Hydrogenophaga sp.]